MIGETSLARIKDVTIHTYKAPEKGWRANTHVIELPSQLVVVDAQYTLPLAREVLEYTRKLVKPITRLYISHYHPDHLLGAATFPCPIYALPEVSAKIGAVGDRVAKEELAKIGDDIPTHAERPDRLVNPGSEMIDSIQFEFMMLQHAETDSALMIGLPDYGILIAQDFVYNRVHAFLGERALDDWSAALQHYRAHPYHRVFPGHGAPGGEELFDTMIHYLSTARGALSQSHDGDDLKSRLIAAFPDFSGRLLLDHQKRFLFP